MSSQVSEKKKQIILATMKLFSIKSYHQTSMQEIADVCAMSKGSLYRYFKSKEELLLNILEYYFQMIEAQCMLIERDLNMSYREKFIKQMEVHLQYSLEYEEFYNMLMHEVSLLESGVIKDYIRTSNIEILHWMDNYLLLIYGEEIDRYSMDCIFILNGMMLMYLKLMIVEKTPLNVKNLASFIMNQLDYVVEGMIKDAKVPMIQEKLWIEEGERFQEKKQHPLILLKKIKARLVGTNQEKKYDEALQSIAILEQELMEMKPRKAIISGMLYNLEGISEIEEMRLELYNLLKVEK